MLNEKRLAAKLRTLTKYKTLAENQVKNFGDAIQTLSDRQLFRINPKSFADEHGFSTQDSLELFIHSAKIGLFDFSYNLLCPSCGGILESHAGIDSFHSNDFRCEPCDVACELTLDDQIEVSFSLNPAIKKINLDSWSSALNYYDYNFSKNYEKAPEVVEYYNNRMAGYYCLQPDEELSVQIPLQTDNSFIRMASIENNTAVTIHIDEEKGEEREFFIDLLDNGFSPRELYAKGSELHLHISNHRKKQAGMVLLTVNKEKMMQLYEKYPSTIRPFFSAKELLNHQSFRDLFRMQNLSDSLNLNVKSLTIMFTDLRGSTEMYDKAGDHLAYRLVQEHFQILTDVVKRHSGAVVKTMGDAVMATFSNPVDGFLAALDMMSKISKLNANWQEKGYEIGLKVGLNEGMALAVNNDERLDYFGQSVNIAARVQGLAKAGEIWLSESVYQSQGIESKLEELGYTAEKQMASLKGVEQPTVVYKCYLQEAV
ncbi:MAG: DUF5939 domain-containing protein [Spirochaetota bacterium]